MSLRVATYNYFAQLLARPVFKEESVRMGSFHESTPGDVDKTERQGNYVPNKNQHNVNIPKQVHPANANNAQDARVVARPMFSPSLKTAHTSSEIYTEPNNKEMETSGNLALRGQIEMINIAS